MGDVLSLIEKAQENISIDENREKEMAARMKKGKFDFEDYLESMKQMRNMGGCQQYSVHDARYGK